MMGSEVGEVVEDFILSDESVTYKNIEEGNPYARIKPRIPLPYFVQPVVDTEGGVTFRSVISLKQPHVVPPHTPQITLFIFVVPSFPPNL